VEQNQWSGNGIGWFAKSTDGKYFLLGECKWNESEMNTVDFFNELKRKVSLLPFSERKTVVPVLFPKKAAKDKQRQAVFSPKDVLTMLRK
jgi:hypothetical protein